MSRFIPCLFLGPNGVSCKDAEDTNRTDLIRSLSSDARTIIVINIQGRIYGLAVSHPVISSQVISSRQFMSSGMRLLLQLLGLLFVLEVVCGFNAI